MNEEIERELVNFKKEIESKFAESSMNQNYKFPRDQSLVGINLRSYDIHFIQSRNKKIEKTSNTPFQTTYLYVIHNIKERDFLII